jgi:hypothetical protein
MENWFTIKLNCHIIYLEENKISAEEMLLLYSVIELLIQGFLENNTTEISILISIPTSAL